MADAAPMDGIVAEELPVERFAMARRFLANRSFVVGSTLFLIVVLIALLADAIAPFDPLKNNFRYRLGQPNAIHLFGTDSFGRDNPEPRPAWQQGCP